MNHLRGIEFQEETKKRLTMMLRHVHEFGAKDHQGGSMGDDDVGCIAHDPRVVVDRLMGMSRLDEIMFDLVACRHYDPSSSDDVNGGPPNVETLVADDTAGDEALIASDTRTSARRGRLLPSLHRWAAPP